MKKANQIIYGLFGVGAILIGVVSLIFQGLIISEAHRTGELSHILREGGAAVIFVGLMSIWCIFNYERRAAVHYFLIVLAFLMAAIHWFDYLTGHRHLMSPLINSVPLIVLGLMAIFDRGVSHAKSGSVPELEHSPSADQSAQKQFEKLQLEIAALRAQQKWENFTRLMPLIAAAITMLGFAVPILVFTLTQRAEHERELRSRDVEQSSRLQAQIRSDADQLLVFTGDKRLATSRAVFLLKDMNTGLNTRLSNGRTLAEESLGYRRGLTEGLVALVMNDCDFNKDPGDVALANAVAQNWDDYATYLKEDSELRLLQHIFFKYIEALKNFRNANPGYLKSFKEVNGSYDVDPKYGAQKEEELRYRYFVVLRDGITFHLKILSKGGLTDQARKVKDTWLEVFEGLVCNPVISKDALSADFANRPCDY